MVYRFIIVEVVIFNSLPAPTKIDLLVGHYSTYFRFEKQVSATAE